MPAAATRSGPTATSGRSAAAECSPSYDVGWFEEPLSPDALDDFRLLASTARVPIAAARSSPAASRSCRGSQGRAFDIVQPDVTKVGGISEERRIAWMAHDNGVAFVPHGWNTALGLAADLQLASAIPGTAFVEYLTGSPYVDDIVAEPWRLDGTGCWPSPMGPALASHSTSTGSRTTRGASACQSAAESPAREIATPAVPPGVRSIPFGRGWNLGP